MSAEYDDELSYMEDMSGIITNGLYGEIYAWCTFNDFTNSKKLYGIH